MKGWIKIHRKSIESAVFQNPNLWQAWTYCLMRANHKTTKILFNGEEVTLKPGQFITGRYAGAKDYNMKPSTFTYQLKKLEKLKMLNIYSNNKNSHITLVNWGVYQTGRDEVNTNLDSKLTPNRHRQEWKNGISKLKPLEKLGD